MDSLDSIIGFSWFRFVEKVGALLFWSGRPPEEQTSSRDSLTVLYGAICTFVVCGCALSHSVGALRCHNDLPFTLSNQGNTSKSVRAWRGGEMLVVCGIAIAMRRIPNPTFRSHFHDRRRDCFLC